MSTPTTSGTGTSAAGPADGTDLHPAGRSRRPVLVAAVALVVVAVVAAVVVVLVRLTGDGEGSQATPPPVERSVDLRDLGAVGDGRTDDTEALQRAFDEAEPGTALLLPEGVVFAHDDLLTLTSPGVTLTGGGTLHATDEERSSLTLAADDVALDGVVLTIEETSRRFEAYEQQRLRIDGHTGVVLRDVVVEGSAAAGVYVGGGTSDFVLEDVEVSGTEADGIHLTQGAHDGRVLSPVVRDVGDDGVAVVSYAPDGEPCARIEIVSPVVDGSTGGRGISVVGGTDITYRDVDVRDTYAAGVYIAAEGSFDTAGVDGVVVDGGTVTGANQGEDIDHGSVLVFNGTDDEQVRDVRIEGLTIGGTRENASREVGLVSEREDGIADVVLAGLVLDGDGPDVPLVSDNEGTTYRAEGWTVGGDDVPDVSDEVVGTDG